MILELAAAFFAGAVTHKVWRVCWRTVRQPVSFREAISDEFAPPTPEQVDRSRRGPTKVSEIV